MKSLNKARIIPADEVQVRDNIVFCTPEGHIKPMQNQAKEDLKSLESYWKKEGFDTGKESGFKEGFEEGKKAGRKEGLEEGKAQGLVEGEAIGVEKGKEEVLAVYRDIFKEGFALIQRVGQSLAEHQSRVFKKGKEEVIDILLALSEEILKQKLQDPQVFEKLLVSLLEFSRSIVYKSPVEIGLSPAAYALLENAKDKFMPKTFGAESIAFYKDPNLLDSTVKIVAPTGLMRYDIKKCLEEIQHKWISSIYSESKDQEELDEELHALIEQFPQEPTLSSQVPNEAEKTKAVEPAESGEEVNAPEQSVEQPVQ